VHDTTDGRALLARFAEEHGGPVLPRGEPRRQWVAADGACVINSGLNLVYHGPDAALRLWHAQQLLAAAERALRDLRPPHAPPARGELVLDAGPPFIWNDELLGRAAPLDQYGQLGFVAALDHLRELVASRKQLVAGLEAEAPAGADPALRLSGTFRIF
jgi:hypothetical protein